LTRAAQGIRLNASTDEWGSLMESQNPYLAPRQTAVQPSEQRDYGFNLVRVYLAAHLFVVVVTAVVVLPISREGQNLPMVVASVLLPVAVFGSFVIYGSPLMMLCLIVAACRYDRRYLSAAVAELVLLLGHIFALSPAFQ
jgi:hypothetical protein